MDNGASSYRRFLEGDDNGMFELVKDYRDGLMLYINSFVHDMHIAEECTEEVFVKLAIKKPKFHGKSQFKTWLYAIGRNLTLNYIRQARHITKISLESCAQMPDELDIERNFLKEEQKILLHQAIRKLKSEYQQVLYLSYFEDFSNAETAKIMHKTKRQIENLLYNARKSLKLELEKDGFHYEKL